MKDEQPAPSSAYAFLNPDVFLFFDQHMDALPMYARLEQAIRSLRSPVSAAGRIMS